MILNNRVILKHSGLTDKTIAAGDPYSDAVDLPIVAAQDCIYLGSEFPFNHRYIQVKTPNDQISGIKVQIWDGGKWNDAVDVFDETANGGKTLARSGIVSWIPDRNKSWAFADTMNIPDLKDLSIYALYWAKITFTQDLKPTTAVEYIGHKFSSDDDLGTEYPDLIRSDMMTAYKAGTTSWDLQTIAAAEYIIQDLRGMKVITSSDQLLDWRLFTKASIHKTAEIIYRGFGPSYAEQLKEAKIAYKAAIQIKFYSVDRNADATANPAERVSVSGVLSR